MYNNYGTIVFCYTCVERIEKMRFLCYNKLNRKYEFIIEVIIMERVISINDFKYYTMLKQILLDLGLVNKEQWWLISDIDAYPRKVEYQDFLYKNDYVLIKTSDLLKMLEEDDFQWVWAVFSVIPLNYTEEEILAYELPHLQLIDEGEYNPYVDKPKLQHPLAEFELYAEDSSSMFLITDNEELLKRFKKVYPSFIEKY